MGRIASFSCLELHGPPLPARFTKIFHVCQEDVIPATVLHHQAISHAHTHASSWQTQWIHGKCICIQFVGTDRSNLRSDFGLHETCVVAPPPQMLCLHPVSTIDCIHSAPYTQRTDTKHKISGWVYSHANEPPPDARRFPTFPKDVTVDGQ